MLRLILKLCIAMFFSMSTFCADVCAEETMKMQLYRQCSSHEFDDKSMAKLEYLSENAASDNKVCVLLGDSIEVIVSLIKHEKHEELEELPDFLSLRRDILGEEGLEDIFDEESLGDIFGEGSKPVQQYELALKFHGENLRKIALWTKHASIGAQVILVSGIDSKSAITKANVVGPIDGSDVILSVSSWTYDYLANKE